jgi:hypothetical protein
MHTDFFKMSASNTVSNILIWLIYQLHFKHRNRIHLCILPFTLILQNFTVHVYLLLLTGSLVDNMWDDGNSLGPKEVHNYLTRVMYNRRNKFNPLWNSLVLGGVKKGEKYLGTVCLTLSCHSV